MKKIFTLSLSGFLAFGAFAQKHEQKIQLLAEEVVLNTSIVELDNYLAKSKNTLVLVQFSQNPNKAFLEQTGWSVQDYMGNNTYLIYTNSKNTIHNMDQNTIVGWHKFDSKNKLAQQLLQVPNNSQLEKRALLFRKDLEIADIKSIVEKYKGNVDAVQPWKSKNIYYINIPNNTLQNLAQSSDVIFITEVLNDVAMLDHAKNYTGSSNAITPLVFGGKGLTGKGIVVGVGDDAQPFHVDMNDRLMNFNPLQKSNHGIHTTGTVGGAGIHEPRFTGFAPKSTLLSNYFSYILNETENYIQDFGMSITNNSYGANLNNCIAMGTYDIYSKALDDQSNQNPTLLHVFAAANSAQNTCSPYPTGYATVAGHYQPSKNVLTVANIGKTETTFSAFSSRGPVKDGRLKPEITAMGSDLFSTGYDNDYFPSSGTSMSSPNVAGAAALVSEYYKNRYSTLPEGALLKALLINGSDDIGTVGPDYRFGYGLMNVEQSLRMIDSTRHYTNTINTSNTQSQTITVPTGTSLLKVMLYWNDVSGNPSAAKALVNDLDLRVVTPTSAVELPWVLDHTPANILLPATKKVDRLNNVEQVTITNPTAGTYTVQVNGFDVSVPNQKYYVVYDFIQEGLKLRFPQGGEKVIAGNNQYIYWNSSFTTGNTVIELSTNNGTSWSTITTITDPTIRSYNHTFPISISSQNCKIRITQNGQSIESNIFTISPRATVTLAPTAEQCPGSAKINWTSVLNATSYRMYKKVGGEMVPVATVSGNTYTFTGLNKDSVQWLSVSAIINTTEGERSIAVNYLPNAGSCVNVTTNDLQINKINNLKSGRQFTSTSLSSNTPLVVEIGNQSGNAATSYKISYQINNSPWVSANYTNIISSGSNLSLALDNINLATPNDYQIKVAIQNLAAIDLVPSNDTLIYTVKQIANDPIDLSSDYFEGFENTTTIPLVNEVIGLDGAEKWDVTRNTIYGRARNYVNGQVSISGNKSLSMDNTINTLNTPSNSSLNATTSTFNLSNYDTAREIRIEFDYAMYAKPKFDTANSVWVRNSDIGNWIKILDYHIDTVNFATQHSGSISLTDIFKNNNISFTSSTQVRFGQYDTSVIAASYWGNGVTIDNFRLYSVANDVMVIGLDSISHYNCGLTNQVPIKVKVANGVNNPLYNIAISYQIDNGNIITENIDSIAAKDTMIYTFNTRADLSVSGRHYINTWVSLFTDTFRNNDSLLNYTIENQPVITSFPYLQNFELNNGSYYAEGVNSSWEFGTPNKRSMQYAASGKNAWVTKLEGNHNGTENSTLYSPCFDISGLINPTLSFSLHANLENKDSATGSLFDYAYIEYSNDGVNWQKLGAQNQGYNWYNDSANVWTGAEAPYWQVATLPIPQSGSIFSFRIRFIADQGTELDGIGIDDIHIYDLQYPINTKDSLNPALTMNIGPWQNVNNYITTPDSSIIATLFDVNGTLGNSSIQTYTHTTFVNQDQSQYYFPRSFVFKSTYPAGDTATFRFFVNDSEMKTLRDANYCPSCDRANDVYRLGITKYRNAINEGTENNTLFDNAENGIEFINPTNISWVPYAKGYYAQVRLSTFGEIWFNNGGATKTKPLGFNTLVFKAAREGMTAANLTWDSYIDTFVHNYQLQRQYLGGNFERIATFTSREELNTASYLFLDRPSLNGEPINYRLQYVLKSDLNTNYYSPIRTLDWSSDYNSARIYPNPVTNGIINIEWVKDNDIPLKWAIYNYVGQVISYGDIPENPYGSKIQLNLNEKAGLSNGLYILRLIANKTAWDYKIIIQNEN